MGEKSDTHHVAHTPFRSCCRWCVAGGRKTHPYFIGSFAGIVLDSSGVLSRRVLRPRLYSPETPMFYAEHCVRMASFSTAFCGSWCGGHLVGTVGYDMQLSCFAFTFVFFKKSHVLRQPARTPPVL